MILGKTKQFKDLKNDSPKSVETSSNRIINQQKSQSQSILTFYLIVQGFHRTYATGAACQQRTLTPPDTWSCPTLGLACVLMSRPISPELVFSPDFWISNTPRYFSFAFNTENFDALKCYESTEVDRRTWLVVKSTLRWSGVLYQKDLWCRDKTTKMRFFWWLLFFY